VPAALVEAHRGGLHAPPRVRADLGERSLVFTIGGLADGGVGFRVYQTGIEESDQAVIAGIPAAAWPDASSGSSWEPPARARSARRPSTRWRFPTRMWSALSGAAARRGRSSGLRRPPAG
jgi:hypothetical protein